MAKVLKTFPIGGVHPCDNKLSASKQIEPVVLPATVTIPLSQHIGAPATPIVKPLDIVKVGQLIAKASGFVSANIHSSVSGTVKKIDNVPDTCGYKRPAIIIDVEDDVWENSIDRTDSLLKEISLSQKDIVEKVQESGIVGLGGATFPTHVKLSVPKGKTCEYLLINGVECEPYLTSDHRLMLEKTEEIFVGIKIVMKALGVSKAIIGIENNKKDAIDKMSAISNNYDGISVQALKVQYPQGGEKQLAKALINREIPAPPGLPIDVGCVIQNVGTIYAIYEAVQKNKPLFERVVTITGRSIKNSSNFLARIGTSISVLIDASGGLPGDTGKIISGGPMMGKALNTTDIPVSKGTSGILILPEQISSRTNISNCIRCAKCVSVCPLGLEPYLLSKLSLRSLFDKAESEQVVNCIECGCCSYNCPSKIPLLDFIRLGKTTVMKNIRNRTK
ncbi:MAG: electron transport complex subunit RsxC [Candidatus Omnitrophica bacterium]|nr:electron transport complex subunit RsxC [Candidatus Omnitrophota bacterium]MBU1996933.1 electron transport complex subunit RsxC [Candidatus Omnitrophota bacterium]